MSESGEQRCDRLPLVYTRGYFADIGSHVFPIDKYRGIIESVEARGWTPLVRLVEPERLPKDDLLLLHTERYVDDLLNLRSTPRTWSSEMPLNQSIVEAYLLAASGTILACRSALECGIAFNVSGGFHHAFPDKAEGFCYANDVAIAVRKLQNVGEAERFAIIDCDLHQGNATAKIFSSDSRVFTFSIHQENLYPVKERSDLDLGLPNKASDSDYLPLLEEHVPSILDKHQPELVIYLAGADPYELDQLGDLMLTESGLEARDRMIMQYARERDIPVAVVMAGGYAPRVEDTVRIHCSTISVALDIMGLLAK